MRGIRNLSFVMGRSGEQLDEARAPQIARPRLRQHARKQDAEEPSLGKRVGGGRSLHARHPTPLGDKSFPMAGSPSRAPLTSEY